MKTCAKCGKNVADGTTLCPNCHSMAFHTDRGSEGVFFDWLLNKSPKLAIIIMSALLMGLIGFCIWFYCSFM